MKCKNCGEFSKEGNAFCSKCGTKLEQEQILCSCGNRVEPGMFFCDKCGERVAKSEHKPPENSKPESYESILSEIFTEQKMMGKFNKAGKGALVGVASGAAVGSFIPIIGTAIGGLAGGIFGAIKGSTSAEEDKKAQRLCNLLSSGLLRIGRWHELPLPKFRLLSKIVFEDASLDWLPTIEKSNAEDFIYNKQKAVIDNTHKTKG